MYGNIFSNSLCGDLYDYPYYYLNRSMLIKKVPKLQMVALVSSQ